MKFVSIVAEYNPLHNGHLYHINKAKPLGDFCIVVMGGDFCQRGFSAVLDKYTRARHAVEAGADIVVELPVVATLNCAERFAKGALRMLEALPMEGTLSFGSESGDIAAIGQAAALLDSEPVQALVRDLVQQGVAYPKARSQALQRLTDRQNAPMVDISAPNNILAMEYVRANKRLALHTLRRTCAYDGTEKGQSASYVRQCLATNDMSYLHEVPSYVATDLAHCTPPQNVLYLAALRRMSKENAALLWGATEGLQNRVWQCAKQANTLQEALALCATKRYTSARIARLFTAALLGMTTDIVRQTEAEPLYYHVLAVRKNRTDLLSVLAQGGQVLTTQRQLQSGTSSQQLDAYAHESYRLLHGVNAPDCIQIV